MPQFVRKICDRRGVGLVNVVLALSLLAVFALVAASLAINEKRSAYDDIVHTNAFLSADSGGEEAVAWLRGQSGAPFILDPDAGNFVVRSTTDEQMDLAGTRQRYDYSIRVRNESLDGGGQLWARHRRGYDASYWDFFYVVDSQGQSGSNGESRVSLIVSKLQSTAN